MYTEETIQLDGECRIDGGVVDRIPHIRKLANRHPTVAVGNHLIALIWKKPASLRWHEGTRYRRKFRRKSPSLCLVQKLCAMKTDSVLAIRIHVVKNVSR